MRIIGNNIFCIGSNSTINELIIVHILLYQSKVNVNFLINCGVQSCYGFHHVASNLLCCFLCKDFLVFV